MPPRLVSLAIVLFWAATTGWLLYREVWPYLGAGEPPPYTIDLTEQVGASPVTWDISSGGKKIGFGISHIKRGPDPTFEMHTEFKFDPQKLTFLKRIEVGKLTSMYRVTQDGQLVALASAVKLREITTRDAPLVEFDVGFEAEVKDGALHPKVTLNGQPQDFFELKPVPVSENGTVLNPMHLLNRLPGLRAGQRWRVPLLDPFSGQGDLVGGLASQGVTIPVLEAAVVDELLLWNDLEVPCRVIEYREPGKAVTARTWARRRDGLVLRQEARHAGYEFVLERVPEK